MIWVYFILLNAILLNFVSEQLHNRLHTNA